MLSFNSAVQAILGWTYQASGSCWVGILVFGYNCGGVEMGLGWRLLHISGCFFGGWGRVNGRFSTRKGVSDDKRRIEVEVCQGIQRGKTLLTASLGVDGGGCDINHDEWSDIGRRDIAFGLVANHRLIWDNGGSYRVEETGSAYIRAEGGCGSFHLVKFDSDARDGCDVGDGGGQKFVLRSSTIKNPWGSYRLTLKTEDIWPIKRHKLKQHVYRCGNIFIPNFALHLSMQSGRWTIFSIFINPNSPLICIGNFSNIYNWCSFTLISAALCYFFIGTCS